MIIIANTDEERDSAMAAIKVLSALGAHMAIRPRTDDSPWVKTLWPNETYL